MPMMLLTALEESPRVNVRAAINALVVDEYAEAMRSGAAFPAVVAFCEKGCERYVLADGRHRARAADKAGLKKIEVEVRVGTETDALKYALSCNTKHGFRRTPDDLQVAYSQFMDNAALSKMHSTRKDQCDLFEVSVSTAQRLEVTWRSSKSSSKTIDAAKQKRKKAAAHFTRNKPPKASRPDDSDGEFDFDAQDFIEGIKLIAQADVDPASLVDKVKPREVTTAFDKLEKLLEALDG